MNAHPVLLPNVDGKDALIPWGLGVDDRYAVFLKQIFGSERQWLYDPTSRIAVPVWEQDGILRVGGKSHLHLLPFEGAETRADVHWLKNLQQSWQGAFVADQIPLDGGRHATDVFVLMLEVDAMVQRDHLDKKWRNQLKKAEKVGGEYRPFRPDEFGSWYDHFRNCMARLQVKARPPEYFQSFITCLQDRLFWNGLWSQGKLVASGLGFTGGGHASLLWQSSEESVREWCANNLYYWKTVRWLAERGVTMFDLGPTSIADPSGAHFKLGLGADRHPVWRYGDAKPGLLARLRDIWKLR